MNDEERCEDLNRILDILHEYGHGGRQRGEWVSDVVRRSLESDRAKLASQDHLLKSIDQVLRDFGFPRWFNTGGTVNTLVSALEVGRFLREAIEHLHSGELGHANTALRKAGCGELQFSVEQIVNREILRRIRCICDEYLDDGEPDEESDA